MRLIDADALLDEMTERMQYIEQRAKRLVYHWQLFNTEQGRVFELRTAMRKVKSAPTIDAEPVRHGRWEHGMRCSGCGQVDTTKPNYCPNCGTKMDGGADNA